MALKNYFLRNIRRTINLKSFVFKIGKKKTTIYLFFNASNKTEEEVNCSDVVHFTFYLLYTKEINVI